MATYSKFIGSIIGGAIGLAGLFGFSEQLAAVTPEVQGGIVMLLSMVATYFAPANKTD